MNELTKDSSLLKERYQESKDIKERERYHALYLYSLGYKKKRIAEIFCVDPDTVKAWIDKWLQEKSVKYKPREGRPELITEEIEKDITKLVEDNDPSNGKTNCTIVDCAYLQNYLLETHKVDVTPEAIRLRLVDLGYHYRKSEYEFTKRDNEKRKEFLESVLPLLKDNGIDVNFLEIGIKVPLAESDISANLFTRFESDRMAVGVFKT